MRWVWAVSVLLPLLGGCDLEIPMEFFVEDLRVLNVRVDPPEIPIFRVDPDRPLSADASALPELDLTEVRLTAFVAHPDPDASFTYDWTRCTPGFRDLPCDDDNEVVERLDERPGPQLGLSPVRLLFEDLIERGASLEGVTEVLGSDPRDLLNGFYAHVNLRVTVDAAAQPVDTQSLDATKRIVVFDPQIVRFALTEAQGFDPGEIPDIPGLPTLCFRATPSQLQAIDEFLATRLVNASPVYDRVEAQFISLDDTSDVLSSTFAIHQGDSVLVPSDRRLQMRGAFSDDTIEAYELIDTNCEIQMFEEKPSFSWFTNYGDLSRQLTTTDTRGVEWARPEEGDEGRRRARIWSVLRDGRGGSDHMFFDIAIEP